MYLLSTHAMISQLMATSYVPNIIVRKIYLGMELNRAEMNHRRVCCMRYLAEMLNFKMV